MRTTAALPLSSERMLITKLNLRLLRVPLSFLEMLNEGSLWRTWAVWMLVARLRPLASKVLADWLNFGLGVWDSVFNGQLETEICRFSSGYELHVCRNVIFRYQNKIEFSVVWLDSFRGYDQNGRDMKNGTNLTREIVARSSSKVYHYKLGGSSREMYKRPEIPF